MPIPDPPGFKPGWQNAELAPELVDLCFKHSAAGQHWEAFWAGRASILVHSFDPAAPTYSDIFSAEDIPDRATFQAVDAAFDPSAVLQQLAQQAPNALAAEQHIQQPAQASSTLQPHGQHAQSCQQPSPAVQHEEQTASTRAFAQTMGGAPGDALPPTSGTGSELHAEDCPAAVLHARAARTHRERLARAKEAAKQCGKDSPDVRLLLLECSCLSGDVKTMATQRILSAATAALQSDYMYRASCCRCCGKPQLSGEDPDFDVAMGRAPRLGLLDSSSSSSRHSSSGAPDKKGSSSKRTTSSKHSSSGSTKITKHTSSGSSNAATENGDSSSGHGSAGHDSEADAGAEAPLRDPVPTHTQRAPCLRAAWALIKAELQHAHAHGIGRRGPGCLRMFTGTVTSLMAWEAPGYDLGAWVYNMLDCLYE